MNKARAAFNLVKTDEEADTAMVQLIAPMMYEKMAESRSKGRRLWWDMERCSNHELQMMLEDHVAKYHNISVTDAEASRRNSVDIANIAAMMAIRVELYGEDA